MESTEDLDRVALGRAIAARRVTLGMKRRDLSEASGLSYPYIAEIENGGKSPSQKALTAIADALQVSPSDLLYSSEVLSDTPAPMVMQMATTNRVRERRSTVTRASASVTSPASNSIIEEMREELRLLARRVARLDDEVRELRTLLSEGDG